MSQHDMDVANGPGLTFRADMNAALQALVSQSSGAATPNPTFPCQVWADTGAGRLKQRNSANTAWLDMGALDSTLRDAVSASSFAVAGGSANAITATYSPAVLTPTDSTVLLIKAAALNTGATTFSPNGLTAKPVVDLSHTALQGGEIVANGEVCFQYNSSVGGGSWVLIYSTGASALAGKIEWFASMAPPTTHLAANGAAVSRTTYAGLFNALTARPTGTVTSGSNSISSVTSPQAMWVGMPISGPGIPAGATVTAVGAGTIALSANATATSTTTVAICPHGVGDGSTTFNVPDGRGKTFRGWDNGAGLDPSRVFGSYQADGNASHTHGVNDPSHSHSQSHSSASSNAAGGVFGPTSGSTSTGAALTGISIQNSGGTEARMKNIALLPCIKY